MFNGKNFKMRLPWVVASHPIPTRLLACYHLAMNVVRSWLGLILLMLLLGCSDDGKVDPSAVFGTSGSGGGATSGFCTDYCGVLVKSASGCEHYNDNLRCEEICKFYVGSACKTTYEAFTECLRNTGSAECFVPDGGKLTLLVTGCHEQYETWIQCRDEKDAGICPY